MKTNFFRMPVASVVVISMCMAVGRAQTVTGTVTGTVSDQSGAVIPGANVAAHNIDTGVNSSATSDSAGIYRIGFLPIGPYQVTVEAK